MPIKYLPIWGVLLYSFKSIASEKYRLLFSVYWFDRAANLFGFDRGVKSIVDGILKSIEFGLTELQVYYI